MRDAGKQMPTTCVKERRCCTDRQGWLDGEHPTVENGIVKRKVCFRRRGECCEDSVLIDVKTADPIIFTNYLSLQLVICAIVAQTEYEPKVN